VRAPIHAASIIDREISATTRGRVFFRLLARAEARLKISVEGNEITLTKRMIQRRLE
jgi:hypothetical protein